MKIGRISRRPLPLESAVRRANPRPRVELFRTFIAVTLAVGLIGTGAIALPSLSPLEAGIEIPPRKGPQLEPDVLADIESVHSAAGKLAGPLAETVADVTRALPSTEIILYCYVVDLGGTLSKIVQSSTSATLDIDASITATR